MNQLPALDQIVLESQRPLLTILDTTLVLVVRSMRAEHPGSAQVPKILWRLAEVQRTAGREDDELATLKLLAERYPRHEHGAKAVKELAKRTL